MRSRFDEQLALLNRELIEMGSLCEEVIALASRALTEGDRELAAKVAPLDEEIDQKERAIDASNVMLICPKCGKATRVAHRVTEVEREDGSKKKKIVRVCKRCKADID